MSTSTTTATTNTITTTTDPSADNTSSFIPFSQVDKITHPVPSTSNEPQQVTKPQKMKKTITDVSRRFSTRILLKKKW